MVFVDTGAWFASAVPDDPDHIAADTWFRQNDQPLVTTDYVFDELLTLLKQRGEYHRSHRLGAAILEERIKNLSFEWVIASDVAEAWITYRDFDDKGWSFTDCVSRAFIDRLGINTAFVFDDHFKQFGNVLVVPQ